METYLTEAELLECQEAFTRNIDEAKDLLYRHSHAIFRTRATAKLEKDLQKITLEYDITWGEKRQAELKKKEMEGNLTDLQEQKELMQIKRWGVPKKDLYSIDMISKRGTGIHLRPLPGIKHAILVSNETLTIPGDILATYGTCMAYMYVFLGFSDYEFL